MWTITAPALAVEYAHEKDYATSQGGTGGSGDAVAAQLTYEWKVDGIEETFALLLSFPAGGCPFPPQGLFRRHVGKLYRCALDYTPR